MTAERRAAPIRLVAVVGTRPEVIKSAPVILAARRRPEQFSVGIVATGQHRDMAEQAMAEFDLHPDVDLGVMAHDQDVAHTLTAALRGLFDSLGAAAPDWVLVQGDTTTTFAGALAAFYRRIPVAHIEAGLRTGLRDSPFPEEANRQLTARLASLHFAPTRAAQAHLLREGIDPRSIHVTGNTGIDALHHALGELRRDRPDGARSGEDHQEILVTAHRRENHGRGMESICAALLDLVERHPRLTVRFPVHPSPAVRRPVGALLGAHPRIELCEPLGYHDFVDAMRSAALILSDSGGVQEEAPTLGTPVLVMRDTTERLEAVEAGTAVVVGTDRARIVDVSSALLEGRMSLPRLSDRINPFGDGRAADRILEAIAEDASRSAGSRRA